MYDIGRLFPEFAVVGVFAILSSNRFGYSGVKIKTAWLDRAVCIARRWINKDGLHMVMLVKLVDISRNLFIHISAMFSFEMVVLIMCVHSKNNREFLKSNINFHIHCIL